MRLFLVLAVFYSINVFSQSVENIKAERQTYIWGEGSGLTLGEADKEALSSLISQISTTVESSTSLKSGSKSVNGNEIFTEDISSVINTYSQATLKNTERIVISNEPEAKVFRYIKRSEISKVFEQRKNKILSFVNNAEINIENNEVADALRYYYWSLVLLKSHPYSDEIMYTDNKGETHLLQTWLPLKINEIFSNINISVTKIEEKENYNAYYLFITYKNKAVANFDFSYWDGSNWSNINSAKNGLGYVELFGSSRNAETLNIKAEYLFEGESKIDREIEDVFASVKHVPFRKSYYTVNMKVADGQKVLASSKKISSSTDEKIELSYVVDTARYKATINEIISSIKSRKYTSSKDLFTQNGYETYLRLMKYGNAKVIGDGDLRFINFGDRIICRSVPMSFDFKRNNRQFIENVVFDINKDGKVENINFALSKIAYDDIIAKDMWKEYDRMVIVNFMENYKTAYALKNIDYIEKVYADDALIITGTVVKLKKNTENRYKDNEIIVYNRQTKQSFIKNLKYQFANKEYINIKFEKSKIRKSGKRGDVYGIQIKQSYFSSNYGDIGYLFLMIDLNDTKNPKIEVRTWQPQEGLSAHDSLYDLSDF